MKATWNNVVIAQSNKTIEIEGNHYFPENAINPEYLRESKTKTYCPWKGEASYYNIEVNGRVNREAAWYYASPKKEAERIKGYIAFWRGVEVSK